MMDSPQGMMSSQPLPQPSPDQGMMAQQSKQTPYNGELTYHGITRPVVNGVAEYEGKKFFVSADGSIVWDEQNRILGSVDQHGNLIPATDELMKKLQDSGLLEQQTKQ